MNLESPKVTVQNNAAYLFAALCDVNNFEKLMPDSIAKFEVTDADSFIFGLKGMPEIKLRMKDKTPNSKIVLGAASDKLPFTLSNYENLLPLAVAKRYITEEEEITLQEWRKSPSTWGK